MIVTMAEIDSRRERIRQLQTKRHACMLNNHPSFSPCTVCAPYGAETEEIRQDIEMMLVFWWSQGCKEVPTAVQPLPSHLVTVGLPDEKKIAIFLLDALTGGALSSLLCAVRDASKPGAETSPPTAAHGWIDLGPHGVDNLKANLKALGF